MAGNYQITKGFIKKASILRSTGADRDKGDAFMEQLKAGIKNINRPYPDHKEGFVGTVLSLEFSVGPKTLYIDIPVEEASSQKVLEMLYQNYIITDQAQATGEDIFVQGWNIWMIPNKEIFIKVKIDVKEGKTYFNVSSIGQTKQSVDFEQKIAEGFTPTNPFTAMSRPATPIARTPVAPARPIAPAAAAQSDELFSGEVAPAGDGGLPF